MDLQDFVILLDINTLKMMNFSNFINQQKTRCNWYLGFESKRNVKNSKRAKVIYNFEICWNTRQNDTGSKL